MRQNCYGMPETPLTRKQAILRLTESEPEIRALGVQRLAIFGSVARSQARVDSDVDILVQFAPEAKTYSHFLSLFGVAGGTSRPQSRTRDGGGAVAILGTADTGGSGRCPSSRVITFGTSWSRRTI